MLWMWQRGRILTRVGSSEVGMTDSPRLTGEKEPDGSATLTYNALGLPMPKYHRRTSARDDLALFMREGL